ncbi:MAG: hypothetical protein HXN30_07505, partial [Prevotella histicola]|nr:hypothetical protein [Prevotella histicola]
QRESEEELEEGGEAGGEEGGFELEPIQPTPPEHRGNNSSNETPRAIKPMKRPKSEDVEI